jgi:hypothetical protein
MQVKPLVWTKKDRRDHWVSYPALFAATGHTTGYVIKRYEGLDFYDLYGPGYMGPNNHFASLEQAVQAAQTDYDNRILSALEHRPIRVCKACGHSENDHPFRHPFISQDSQ